MNHILSLEIPDTLNTKFLRIFDMSDYEERMPVECQRLDVTPPGYAHTVIFGADEIEPGFDLVLSSCNLGMQTYNCGSNRLVLPDGIYVIKYSVNPNDTVFVEYNHLRVTSLLQDYRSAFCCIPLDGTEPDEETRKKLDLLYEIRSYIEAAKIKAEDCHEPHKAMELYNYAKLLLSKFKC